MDAKRKKMAMALLEMAADTFGNHGCNDFDLRQFGFTTEEMRTLCREMHEWNGDPEEAARVDDKSLPWCLPDFVAMRLVSYWLLGEPK